MAMPRNRLWEAYEGHVFVAYGEVGTIALGISRYSTDQCIFDPAARSYQDDLSSVLRFSKDCRRCSRCDSKMFVLDLGLHSITFVLED